MSNSYIYAETAFHHEGDLTFLKGLIDAAKHSGANGVKFQVLTEASDFVSTQHTAFDALKSYCLTYEQWQEAFAYTHSCGLDIIMMPLNIASMELAKEFDMRYLDIHSVSFYDEELLEVVRDSGLDIILGVGGRTQEEIAAKKDYFGSSLKVLMVGFQSFPSVLENVRIGKIPHLKARFPDVAIGYADHSSFDHPHAIDSNAYARLLGATIFEKHLTTTAGIERVDFSAAISEEGMKTIVDQLHFIDQHVLTDEAHSFELTEAEVVYRNRQLRAVAAKDLPEGTQLKATDLELKLYHEQTDSFASKADLEGRTLKTTISKDTLITTNELL